MTDVEREELRKLCTDVAKLNTTNQFVIKIQADALLASQKLEESKDERRKKEGSSDECVDAPSS